MKYQDWITYNEIAIKKFEGKEDFRYQVETMKLQTNQMKLLSPAKLNQIIPKTTANKIMKNFKILGINIIEILPDASLISDKDVLISEINKIARDMTK